MEPSQPSLNECPFFEEPGSQRSARIEAVVMDMNTAFDLEVREHCPKARIVYDLFHAVAKSSREVINRVCVDEANQLRHDNPARKVINRMAYGYLNSRSDTQYCERSHTIDAPFQTTLTDALAKLCDFHPHDGHFIETVKSTKKTAGFMRLFQSSSESG